MDANAADTTHSDVQVAGGKMILKEFDGPGGSWNWRLMFSDNRTTVNSGAVDNGVCVRYNDDGTWTLGTDPAIDDDSEVPDACAGVDDKVNLVRLTDAGQFVHVATFRMIFELTLAPE